MAGTLVQGGGALGELDLHWAQIITFMLVSDSQRVCRAAIQQSEAIIGRMPPDPRSPVSA